MTVSTYTDAQRPMAFLLVEAPGSLSRENGAVVSGAGVITPGMVLGRIDRRQAAAPIPSISGTGSGVMSGLTFGPDVQVGNYVVTLLATSSTAAFSVTAPDGTALPNGAVGTAYKSNHISFSVANGGTMTVGDSYTVAVTAGGTPVLVGTGSGTVSAVSLGPKAQIGTYKVRLTATSATALFEVIAPSGAVVGTGNVATAFTSDQVNFSLANGGTMTIGDYFNIIVANYTPTTTYATPWDPAAVNGAQNVWGVACSQVDATSAAQDIAIIRRLAEVAAEMLTWKSTVTAAQKADAYRQMASLHLIVRS